MRAFPIGWTSLVLLSSVLFGNSLYGKTTLVPVAFYSPETSIAAGGAITLSSPTTPHNSLAGIAYVTLKGQYLISGSTTLNWNEDLWRFEADLSYSHYPDRLYSPGVDSSEEYGEFTLHKLNTRMSIQRRFKDWHFGPTIAYAVYKSYEIEPARNQNVEEWIGLERASIFGIGFNLSQDRRDHPFDPRRGHYTKVQLTRYLGVSFAFSKFTEFKFSHRRYWAISKRLSWAGAFHFNYSSNQAPYHSLPSFGDQAGGVRLMRGYYNRRFRDQFLVAFQNELRILITKRWTAMAFCDVGQVAPNIESIRFRAYKVTLGLGIGFFVDKTVRMPVFIEGGLSKEGLTLGIKPMAAF